MQQKNWKQQPCGIYKITNLINGKMYIGQSVQIWTRWSQYKTTSHQEKKPEDYAIQSALKEYGFDNFKFEIIEECSREKLNEREIYWIAYYDTYYNGYNETKGGQGGNYIGAGAIEVEQYSLDGKYIATYPSIAEAERQTGATNISAVCLGDALTSNNYQWFHKGKANPKNYLLEKHDNSSKSIIQYTLDKKKVNEFLSIADAAKTTGIDPSGIGRVCNRKQKTSGGFIWRFKDDDYDIYSIDIRHKGTIKAHKVLQIDKNTQQIIKVYNSAKEASQLTGIGLTNIQKTCAEKQKTAGGYCWKYIK